MNFINDPESSNLKHKPNFKILLFVDSGIILRIGKILQIKKMIFNMSKNLPKKTLVGF